jgi:GNAT superfamily N-acetyltransferase
MLMPRDLDSARRDLIELEARWAPRGVEIGADVTSRGGGWLHLSRIVVNKRLRGEGVGTLAMSELVDLADHHDLSMSLSPATDFGGTSVERLRRFYRRFGFVSNKGRRKDYTVSASMHRKQSR